VREKAWGSKIATLSEHIIEHRLKRIERTNANFRKF
jgi:hypothetical protein